MSRKIARIPKKQIPTAIPRQSQIVDVPAPIGGLNTRDSQSTMAITDATELVNWIPQANGLVSRKGYESATTGYSAVPETIIQYINGSTQELITASGTTLYTDNGGGTLTSIGTSLNNARWRGVQVGSNLLLVNKSATSPRYWDGATLQTPTITGDLATYGETNINGVHKHNNRTYMWDTSYPNFFYSNTTNAVSGQFDEFNLENISDTSGNIIEIKTISRDAGDGPDDYLAFILSTGEIIIYQGSDPGTASNWSLVGKYKAPPIIALNCAIEYGGDIIIATQNDIIKLSDVIKYGGEQGGFNISPSKLSGAVRDNYLTYGTNYGWQLTTFPAEGWIMLNVPQVNNSSYVQYVINTITGAATKFTGWNGSRFGVLGNNFYFGNGTSLFQCQTGEDDNGSNIQLTAIQASSNLGIGRKKKPHNVRLYMSSEGNLLIGLSLGFDFQRRQNESTQQSQTSGAQWNVADWDLEDWSGQQARILTFTTSGIGTYISPKLSIDLSGQEIVWYSTSYNLNVSQTY